jgi:hypothetical protein
MCGAVARAGSYLDNSIGRLCPKGTYTNSLNSAGACTRCAPGVTTLAEGSSSEAACDRAIKGYKYTGPNTAEKCEVNTYSNAETTNNACTPCPFSEWADCRLSQACRASHGMLTGALSCGIVAIQPPTVTAAAS